MKHRSLSNSKCDRHLKAVEESIGRKEVLKYKSINMQKKTRGGAADIKILHFRKKNKKNLILRQIVRNGRF